MPRFTRTTRDRALTTVSAAVLSFVFGASLAGGAAAQAAGSVAPPAATNTVEEVVVHAERVETKLQQTPIAVTAIGAQSLDAQSVRNVGDVVNTVPNVAKTSGPAGGNDGFFFIRGIGQVDSNPAGDPGVGVYIDEVYLGRIQGASLDTLDLSQIEVLRGPQGTLFGRNTIGGAVNVITADPGREFSGHVRLTGGSRDRREALASVDLPASDDLGVNISAFTRHQTGWGKNVYNGTTYGDIDDSGARLKAVWRPIAPLKIIFSADVSRSDGSPAQTVLTGFNPAAGQIPGTTPLGVPFPKDLLADTSTDPDKSFASIPPINRLRSDGESLIVSYDLGGATLKSITSHRELSQLAYNDFDGTAYKLYDNFFDTHQHQFSQELQLSGDSFENRLHWVGGLYYYDEHVRHDNAICMGTNSGTPPGNVSVRFGSGCLLNNQAFTLAIKSWAGFGNLRWDLTDRLTLTVGGRYTHEEKAQDYNFSVDNTAGVFSFFGFPPAKIPTLVTNVSASWDKFTPKVGLDYKAADNVFLYASYGRGFKSGGFDGRPIPGSPIRSYSPEQIDTYEVGAKTDWLDHKLRLNLAAFYSDYKDIQLLVIDPASGFFVLTNAGSDHIKGVEAELTATPTANLRLEANLGLMDNQYYRLSPGAMLSGIGKSNKLPLTPDLTSNLAAQYTVPLSFGDLLLRADYNYRSKVYYGAPNAPLEVGKALGLLDLRGQLTLSHSITVAVFGKNVTDKSYYSNAQDVRQALGISFAQVGAPREWGMELGYKF